MSANPTRIVPMDSEGDPLMSAQQANTLFSALMAAKASDKVSRRATLYALKAYIQVLEDSSESKQITGSGGSLSSGSSAS